MSSSRHQTNNTLVDLAIHFNTDGVRLMCANKHLKAIAPLQKALNYLQQQLALPNTEEQAKGKDGNQTVDHREAAHGLNFQLEFASEVDGEFPSSRNDDDDGTRDIDEPFIFKNPIVVSRIGNSNPSMDFGALITTMEEAPSRRDRLVSQSSLVKFTFSVLLNLGIAMHVGALAAAAALSATTATDEEEGHVKEVTYRRLTKCTGFYELAYTMMQDEQIHGITETMAIINNIGHVNSVVGNTEKAQQCYERVLSFILYVIDNGDEEAMSSLQFNHFFQSALAAVLPQAPVAQAA